MSGNTTGGKTSFIFLMLTARGSETPIRLLGHVVTPAPAGRYIVVVEPEHSKGSAARKFKKSAKILGVDCASLFKRLIIVSGSESLLVGDSRWKQLCQLIAAGLVSDILLDTIASTTKEIGNDEQAQSALFHKLRHAIEDAPEGVPLPVVWPLTHNKKAGKDEDEIDIAFVSGSLQRAAQSNTIMMLRTNRKDHRIVSSTVFFLKMKEEPIGGFKDGDEKPKTFSITQDRLQLLGKNVVGSLKDVIYEMLCLTPEGLSMSSLRARVDRNKADIRAALDALIKSKKVVEETRGGDEGGDEGGTNVPAVTLFFAVSSEKINNLTGGGDEKRRKTKKGRGGDEGGDEGGTKNGCCCQSR